MYVASPMVIILYTFSARDNVTCTCSFHYSLLDTFLCAGLSGLRELSLDNTIITDQGIKYIAGTRTCKIVNILIILCDVMIIYVEKEMIQSL